MKFKKSFGLLAVVFMMILVFGCEKNEELIIYGDSGNIDIESLTKCLKEKEIYYKVDEKKNVLIKQSENEKAVMYCS